MSGPGLGRAGPKGLRPRCHFLFPTVWIPVAPTPPLPRARSALAKHWGRRGFRHQSPCLYPQPAALGEARRTNQASQEQAPPAPPFMQIPVPTLLEPTLSPRSNPHHTLNPTTLPTSSAHSAQPQPDHGPSLNPKLHVNYYPHGNPILTTPVVLNLTLTLHHPNLSFIPNLTLTHTWT